MKLKKFKGVEERVKITNFIKSDLEIHLKIRQGNKGSIELVFHPRKNKFPKISKKMVIRRIFLSPQ
ncbi:MAG: hypothetical protein D6756_06470 [Cyanobacteria bacterium J083]|nr:MAG: hypothetical protein D6756_06470 [Cyanobacteria bacterium J083]